jgi:hypothetical protein
LIRPSQRATGGGIGSPETGKFTTAFVVSPPQSSVRSSVLATAPSLALHRVEAAADVERALAKEAPGLLGELGTRGPADVAALRALVERRTVLAGADRAPVSAA